MKHQNLVPNAINFAHRAHAGQTRRDLTTPYFAHVSAVAISVASHFAYADQGDVYVATAYLHDVLEDTDTTESDLVAIFPPEVVFAVKAMTHRKHESYPDYIARVASNPVATLVKLHDIRSNLSDAPTDRQVAKYEAALPILTEAHETHVWRSFPQDSHLTA